MHRLPSIYYGVEVGAANGIRPKLVTFENSERLAKQLQVGDLELMLDAFRHCKYIPHAQIDDLPTIVTNIGDVLSEFGAHEGQLANLKEPGIAALMDMAQWARKDAYIPRSVRLKVLEVAGTISGLLGYELIYEDYIRIARADGLLSSTGVSQAQPGDFAWDLRQYFGPLSVAKKEIATNFANPRYHLTLPHQALLLARYRDISLDEQLDDAELGTDARYLLRGVPR